MDTLGKALRTGGEVLVDGLQIHGADTVFCVPGESYLAVLDALHDKSSSIKTITCRQEGGAANMAEADGKLTGKPGVVMVTRGPGACNAAIGVHTAYQDSTPMVVLIGQVARDQQYREAFQELDYRQFYGPLCKWVAQIESAERIPELLSQAFLQATSGRPGPVALALPEDMLRDRVEVQDMPAHTPVRPGVDQASLEQMMDALSQAERPLMLVGGSGWSSTACGDIEQFAAANNLPTVAAFRRQDRFDNTHRNYVGDTGLGTNPKLGERIGNADLIICVGARLGELTTAGYTLLKPPLPKQKLIHIHQDPNELGRVFHPTLSICAGIEAFAKASSVLAPVNANRWSAWTEEARQDYLGYLEPTPDLPGAMQMGEVMTHLRDALPPLAILTTDAGNFSAWMHRHYQYRHYPSQLGPTSGAMGYGIPAAIAARLRHPDRPVVGFCGDGGALMTGQEIATAVHHGIDPVILIINNNMYGTIRMHQERDYPYRESATALTNPDFATWAMSFGAHGERIDNSADFPHAFERALNIGKIAIIELAIDPELITTHRSLSDIRGTRRDP